MNGGLAPAREGKLWGFINAKGAWVIQPKFQAAKAFDEGFAEIQFAEGHSKSMMCYINHAGKVIWPRTQ